MADLDALIIGKMSRGDLIGRAIDEQRDYVARHRQADAMQRLCERLRFVRSGSIQNLVVGDPDLIYFIRLR